MNAMSIDDLLIGIIIAGIGLTGAYFRAEYVSWLRYKAARERQEVHRRRLRLDALAPKRIMIFRDSRILGYITGGD
jgi:hypothetical protein